jgi:NAD-dependent SIR2 family protein deacetylase
MKAAGHIRAAANAIRSARALVVTAGAGMGVDSGLPDFRGDQGFWKAYPPYERLGVSFVDAANPARFDEDPEFGWGFYGHRLGLYRSTVPHRGFGILQAWVRDLGLKCFVVTSNVDGQFQTAGFDSEYIEEVHGSIHHLQCTTPCSDAIWENQEDVPIDVDSMRSLRVPRCPRCGAVSRPNILMFGDWAWVADRSNAQRQAFGGWLQEVAGGPLVAIEMGAGTSIPTIRMTTERLASLPGATAIRINPREADIEGPSLSIPKGALEGLEAINAALRA